ncbi:hypothetical protein RJ640_001471, partial [Escallonia rubra]
VASRVLQLVKDSYKTGGLSDAPFCCLGDILLFGNVDRTASDIDEIYLDYRVEKLVECFGSPSGWKQSFNSMTKLLQDCVSRNRIFDTGTVCEKQRASEAEVVRGEFKSLALSVKGCVSTLCTHLPMSFILEHNLKTMVSLVALLNAFETLLFRDNLVSSHVNMDSEMIQYSGTECLSVLKTLRHSLEKLNFPNAANKVSIEKLCFQMASSIFCTASSSYRLHTVPMDSIKLLVIDEAAQLKECESLIPLQITAIKHAILIGDECQLSATISSKVSEEAGFGRSLFERLSLLNHPKHLLNTQYRMHPSITAEASKQKISIGLVSPYSAQVAAIEQKLGRKYENHDSFRVKVRSIDGYQGGEQDIIILSTVRSNRRGSIGFTSSPRRINVALTRARHCLWILGNERTLTNSGCIWDELVLDAKHRQCFYDADEDSELAKIIMDVKKELNQLDDLLNGDSTLFKCARWKLLFSDNFRKSFSKLRSSETKYLVLLLLSKLSNGWRPKRSSCESPFDILKQFKVGDLYIISSTDLVKESWYISSLEGLGYPAFPRSSKVD